MGGKPEVYLEKVEDEQYQYYAQVEGVTLGLEDFPNEPREESGDFTRIFRLYTSPENRTEEGYPKLEVEDTDIKMGDQRQEYSGEEEEVMLEVDLDNIEENPPESSDADFDLSSQEFDSEADRKKHTELQRAVREWHQSHRAPLGV